jgi:GNAT superfamily N-acetyltransferase
MLAIETITRDQLEQHLLELDQDSCVCRFGYAANPTTIKMYVDSIPEGDMLFGIRPSLINDRVAAAVHLAISPDGSTAELGISTLPEFKRRGMGERVLRYAVDILRNRGIKQIYSVCMPDNSPLMNLIRKLNITSITSSPGQREATINIPMAGIDSVLAELRNDRMIIVDSAMKPWAELWGKMLNIDTK